MTTCKISGLISPAFYGSHRAVKSGAVSELVEKGGRGSAKSSFVSIELLLLLLRHPGCHAVVLRKVAGTLRTSVYAQVCWAIGVLGLSPQFRCTVSPPECTYLPTGQKILFFGMDDPGKLKSIKTPSGYIGIAWFEELDQFAGEEEIRHVEQSLFRGGPFSFSFKSFNPPAAARNWANRYVREGRPGRLVHHSTYLTTPPEWLGARFLEDAAHLKAADPTAYRHEYLGEPVGADAQVFGNLVLREIGDAELAALDRRYYGQDWGWYPDPNAFNGCAYDAAGQSLYVFEEYRGNRMSNAAWARLIRAHRDDLVTADPGGGGLRNVGDFRAAGFRMRCAAKGPGSVAYSMQWLQSRRQIVIDPARCPHTAREFTEYEYARDSRTGEVLEGYPDGNNHHIDAVRYATEQIWKRKGQ